MRFRLSIVCVVFSLGTVLPLAGCQRKPAQSGSSVVGEIGYGSVAGHTYSNVFFGLAVTFPDDWYIQSREEFDELSRLGLEVATASNKSLKAAAAASQTTTLNLVAAFQHPPGTPVPFNANIIITTEKVKHLPGIKSGSDYLQHMQRTLAMTALKYEFDPIESDQKLGSLAAHCLPTTLQAGIIEVRQRMYATRYRDYALVMAVSYSSDEQFEKLKPILDGIQAGGKQP